MNQAMAFGVRRPELRSVSGLGSPMLIGIVRPVIVFPSETLGRLSVSEQKMVFGHELAHIRRADVFWGLIAAAVRAVFFFVKLSLNVVTESNCVLVRGGGEQLEVNRWSAG